MICSDQEFFNQCFSTQHVASGYTLIFLTEYFQRGNTMASNMPKEIDHTLVAVGGSTTRAEVGLETTGLFQQISNDLAGLGRRFVVFLKNIGRMALCKPCIIIVPRPSQLDLNAFVGGQEGWRFDE